MAASDQRSERSTIMFRKDSQTRSVHIHFRAVREHLSLKRTTQLWRHLFLEPLAEINDIPSRRAEETKGTLTEASSLIAPKLVTFCRPFVITAMLHEWICLPLLTADK